MSCLMKLTDLYTGGITGQGVFYDIYRFHQNPIPWTNSLFIDQTALDVEYYGNISGNKIVSPLLDKMVVNDTLTEQNRRSIVKILESMYFRKWGQEFSIQEYEYSPLSNYDMTEQMTDDENRVLHGKTTLVTGTDTRTNTGTETETDNLQEQRTDNLSDQRTDNLSKSVDRMVTETFDTDDTETPNLTNSTDNKIFGFNSNIGVDSDSQTVTATGSTTKTKTGTVETETDETEANTGTQTTQHTGTSTNTKTGTIQNTFNNSDSLQSSVQHVDGGTDVSIRNYTLTRSGNIGVTTSQQMLEQERNLWLWDYFYKVVFPDIDKILTIPIY